MDLFISWSGDHSRRVALALKNWLPFVIQSVKPFVSDKDIHSGSRWQAEISSRLEVTNFGIVVVTPENQKSPWLQFEAGALSKAVVDSRVVPLLVGMKKSELLSPLNMFQAELLDKSGVEALLLSISRSLDNPLSESAVKELAEMWWGRLESSVTAVTPEATGHEVQRSERELLEELLMRVRELGNSSGLSKIEPNRYQDSRDAVRDQSVASRLPPVSAARQARMLMQRLGEPFDDLRVDFEDGSLYLRTLVGELSSTGVARLADLAVRSNLAIYVQNAAGVSLNAFPPF